MEATVIVTFLALAQYTLFGILDTDADLGLIAEYLYDDRDVQASTPFEDDLFLGIRLALNDVQSTEILAGIITDLGGNGRFFNLEASRRLGDAWKLALEARVFSNIEAHDPLFTLQQDDYLHAELSWYF